MVGDSVIFLLQRQSAISFDHNGGQVKLHSANDAAVNRWKKQQ